MAETVVSLNSDMASYISGVLMVVDYGLDIQMVASLMSDWYGGKGISKKPEELIYCCVY